MSQKKFARNLSNFTLPECKNKYAQNSYEKGNYFAIFLYLYDDTIMILVYELIRNSIMKNCYKKGDDVVC